MSCSPFDLKDYFLKELPAERVLQVESHVRTCTSCREELDRLSLMEAALMALRQEEIPQRIAFVSDKVFEPSPWRRWWAGFWGSAARLGFASAAMLSVAILVFALTRPAASPSSPMLAQAPVTAASDIDGRIQAAVDKAVSASEVRQGERTQKMVSDFLQREREDNVRLARAADTIQYLERRYNVLTMYASGYRTGSGAGGAQ